MGLTVASIIERSLSEIYEAGASARPAFDFLAGTIDTDDTSLVLEGKANFVPEFSLLEFYDDTMEIAEAGDPDGTTVPLLTRGYLETTAGSHADGTRVVLDSPYPRQVLLNGLKALIGQLFAYDIYAKGYVDNLTVNTISPVAVAGAKDVLSILWQDGPDWVPMSPNSYRVFHDYSGLDTVGVKFFSYARQGAATRIVYAKDFDLDPFTLTTDLDDVGVSSTLQPHLPLGLAAHILQGRDVPLVESEHIRPDPQNPQQIGSRFSVGRTLWTQFLTGPVMAERTRLMKAHPPRILSGAHLG